MPETTQTNRRRHSLQVTLEERAQIRSALFGHGRKPGQVFQFWMLTMLSVVIAVMGETLDSTAIVIGAMLIAPLMDPILAVAAGITFGSTRWTSRAALKVVAASLVGVGLAAGLTALIPGDNLTNEVTSRTAPDLRDLVVAVAAGIAGAYATAKPDRSSALPGVAVAVALVPPLAAIGITLTEGRLDLAEGATLLYVTNLLAITAVGVVVFLVLGLGPRSRDSVRKRWARTGTLVAALVTAPLTYILYNQSTSIASRNDRLNTVEEEVDRWIAATPTLQVDDLRLETDLVTVDLSGPEEPPPIDGLNAALDDAIGNVEVRVRWSQQVQRSSTDVPDPNDATIAAVTAAAEEWIEPAAPDRITGVDVSDGVAVIEVAGTNTPPASATLADLLEQQGINLTLDIRWTQQSQLSDEELRLQERITQIADVARDWASSLNPPLDVTDTGLEGTVAIIDVAGPVSAPDPAPLYEMLKEQVDPELTAEVRLTVRVPVETTTTTTTTTPPPAALFPAPPPG